jgi:hypothetical protein
LFTSCCLTKTTNSFITVRSGRVGPRRRRRQPLRAAYLSVSLGRLLTPFLQRPQAIRRRCCEIPAHRIDSCRRGAKADRSCTSRKFNCVPTADGSLNQDGAISTGLGIDRTQELRVGLRRIWIERDHLAARACRMELGQIQQAVAIDVRRAFTGFGWMTVIGISCSDMASLFLRLVRPAKSACPSRCSPGTCSTNRFLATGPAQPATDVHASGARP